MAQILHQLHAGGEQGRDDQDAPGDATLAAARPSDKAIDDLARMWNPVLRGWIQYYGRFYKSALYPSASRRPA
jgi:hypothetical protein